MVLTVSFVLSPVIGLSCHRRFADISAKLDAGVEASGPHDFAVHRKRPRRKRRPRPPHPALTSVTIAKRPSRRDGTELQYSCFYPAVKRISENPK
jgi:hypothetical protein